MNLTDTLDIVRLSDVGLEREHNEDAVASDAEMGLVLLADGMGGYQAGEVASEMALLTIITALKTSMSTMEPGQLDRATGMQMEHLLLAEAVAQANAAIYHTSQTHSECAGMGTTLVAGLFTNNRLLVGHIGDARMYRLRDDVFSRITEDHSVLQEQINAGLITVEQARSSNNKNLVTRALGVDPSVELELHEYDVQPADIYLLCSDGLSDLVEDADIHLALSTLSANLQLAANQLVQMANDPGGVDNISVILARVLKPYTIKRNWYDNLLGWVK